jgi:phospholipid-translocating ATPase
MIKAVEQFFPNSGILDSEDLLTVQEGKSHTMIRSTSGSHRMQRTQTGLSGIVGGDNGRRPGGFVLVIDGSGLNEVLYIQCLCTMYHLFNRL